MQLRLIKVLYQKSFDQVEAAVCVSLRFILTAENHHCSSSPAWQTVALLKQQGIPVVSGGESATPQRNFSSHSFPSDSFGSIPAQFTLLQMLAESTGRLLRMSHQGAARDSNCCFIPEMFHPGHATQSHSAAASLYALRNRRCRCFQPSASCWGCC